MTLQQGTIIKERYEIESIIAQGGMGAIYKAKDTALNVTVALKENLFSEDVAIRQFKAEARILANLRHPNLPRVTDHFEIEGQGQYLIMDYIGGDDIKDILNHTGILTEDEAIKVGISICDALAYLHDRTPPVVHRDIKPGNVKYSSSGVVHLVDFGLAKQAVAGEHTMTGAQALTPGFAPPEQYGQGTDPRTDIYSLGATLFAAVTMQAPPDGLTRATSNATYLDISEMNPKISREFSDVINKAMKIHVDDRYQNAKQFKQALEALGQVESLEDTRTEMLPKSTDNFIGQNQLEPDLVKPKSKRWWIPVAIIVGLILMGITAASIIGSLKNQKLEPTGTVIALIEQNTETKQAETTLETFTPEIPTITPEPLVSTKTIEPAVEATNTTVPEAVVSTPVGSGGRLIAFASDRNGGLPQIYTIDVDTFEISQITELDKGACQPDWSPDGQQIVFTSPCAKDELDYKGSRLYITSVDGSSLRPLNTIPGGDFDPSWNPTDENLIAFVSYRENNRPHLFIYHLDTNQAEGLSASTAYDRAPEWSSDGEILLFQKVFNGITQIYTIEVATKQLTSITNGLVDAYDPAWSNSGQLIYFSEGNLGGMSVRLAGIQYGNASGTKFELEQPKPVWGIDFSDDDFWVAYYGIGEGVNRDIFIMLSTGEMITPITNDAAHDFDPKWQPEQSD